RLLFGTDNILSLKGLFFMVVGGLLVGFGTRYAGGCTSGHAISGLASLQWPSLVATICFMSILVTLLSAVAGTWLYGYFRDKLPH
ncbi:MAG: YeeE/YedE family protein, partial [Bacteroidota bacterium]